ncbi:MAG TPA: tetratricopeptide repeat protein [Actinoplanes sp.]|nr:tetratricopeptide repeat protein [Actinoplanes sp.]
MLDRLRKLFTPETPGTAAPRPARNPEAEGRWDVMEAEKQGEPLLRQLVDRGDPRGWQLLSTLLSYYERSGELTEARHRLAATATASQLRELVHQSSGFGPENRLDALCFQEAVVTRFPPDADGLQRFAAVLAEAGRFDEAMTRFREAIRLGDPKPYFHRWPQSTIKSLTAAGRYDDAEELLRTYPDESYAVSALALMLQVRDRTAEAEELLRPRVEENLPAHMVMHQEVLRLTLFTLLERDGRLDEAAVLRPEHGWRHQWGRPEQASPWGEPWQTPEQKRHHTIWSVVDEWSRGTAI